MRQHPLHGFWKDVLEFQEFLELTDETKFVPAKETPADSTKTKPDDSLIKEEKDLSLLVPDVAPIAAEEPPKEAGTPKEPQEKTKETQEEPMDLCRDASEVLNSAEDCVNSGKSEESDSKSKLLCVDPSDREFFCLGRGLGTQDYVGQRVLQIATILRNLSFIDENVPSLVKNGAFVRFFLLCASSQWAHLRNLGLDMLGNVACEFLVKDLPNDKFASYLLKVVLNGLQSEDRAFCISSLEVSCFGLTI